MRFSEPWGAFRRPDGTLVWRPVLRVPLPGDRGWERYRFLVDSGADLSVASRRTCDAMGKCWEEGVERVLTGLAQKEECRVVSRVHQVRLPLPQLGMSIELPMAFAEGHAPLLLGRDGFFEYFRVTFDRPALITQFEFVGQLQ
jgi:hypothetical protein